MPGRKNYVVWGEGLAFDSTNGFFFPKLESVQFTFGIENLDIPDADSFVKTIIPIECPVSGHIIFGEMNADLMALLTGGSATAAGQDRVRREADTAVGACIGLGATPITYSEIIRTPGYVMKRVSATPGTGEYTIAGTHVVVGAAHATATFSSDYLVAAATPNMTVNVDDDNYPTSFGLVATLRSVDLAVTSEIRSDVVIVCPKVKRMGEFSLGAAAGEQQKIEFDFNVEKAPGEQVYQIMFPSA